NLARSVSRPTSATYDYHLRRGVKFWDGSELTADDVANAINYQRHPSSEGTNGALTSVKSVKALNRYTVRVTLKHPDAGWPYVFTHAGFVWEKRFQDDHRTTFGQPGSLVMGTGPYQIEKLDPTQGAEF